jgi:hypothetical protein
MAHSLSLVANQELSILEHVAKNPNNKTRLDLDRAGKLAKLLFDLDKLRKANAMPVVKDDDNPLAALKPTGTAKKNRVLSRMGTVPSPPPVPSRSLPSWLLELSYQSG